MNPKIDTLYALQIGLLSDDDKRRLMELIARDLGAKNGTSSINKPPNVGQLRERFRSHAGAVSLGQPTGACNEDIDADLASEYGSSHESI